MSRITFLKRCWLIAVTAVLMPPSTSYAAVALDAAAEAEHELFAARYKHAAALYADLVKQDSDWAPGHYGLVRALIEDERAREAYKAADDGLKRLPKAAETITASGFAAFRRGDLVKADEYFNKARLVSPQYPGAFEGLAQLSYCVSDFKSARDFYLSAYHFQSNDPDLITAWAETTKGAEHIAALERALALYDPASREARSLRTHVASDKALGDRKVHQLTSPYQDYKIKMLSITSDSRSARGLGAVLS